MEMLVDGEYGGFPFFSQELSSLLRLAVRMKPLRTRHPYVCAQAATAELSKALDSGSREPRSIPVSALLLRFFRTAHAEENTHGQCTQPLMWLFVHPKKGRTPRGDVLAGKALKEILYIFTSRKKMRFSHLHLPTSAHDVPYGLQ